MKYKRVSFGAGHIDVYTLFEFKRFLSLTLHKFNTIEQDRFHSHAFGAISIMIKGGYAEEYVDNGEIKTKHIKPGIRYIPRGYEHRLLESRPNTWTILFAGPWSKTWFERKDGVVTKLGWGRAVIND
jgi:hypothetical protein